MICRNWLTVVKACQSTVVLPVNAGSILCQVRVVVRLDAYCIKAKMYFKCGDGSIGLFPQGVLSELCMPHAPEN